MGEAASPDPLGGETRRSVCCAAPWPATTAGGPVAPPHVSPLRSSTPSPQVPPPAPSAVASSPSGRCTTSSPLSSPPPPVRPHLLRHRRRLHLHPRHLLRHRWHRHARRHQVLHGGHLHHQHRPHPTYLLDPPNLPDLYHPPPAVHGRAHHLAGRPHQLPRRRRRPRQDRVRRGADRCHRPDRSVTTSFLARLPWCLTMVPLNKSLPCCWENPLNQADVRFWSRRPTVFPS